MGLRERKKLATRRTLQHEALRLAIEHGSENVTVDDIAAAANVSTRTFFNYFSSKDEAIIGDGPPRPTEEATAVFVANGPTGDLLDDLKHFILSPMLDLSAEELGYSFTDFLARKQLMHREPHLVTRMMATFAATERQVVEGVAARLDEEPEAIRPQIVAALGMTALRFALRHLHNHGDGAEGAGAEGVRAAEIAELRDLLDEAFDALRRTFDTAR
ncbi:TetR family transcriptional regulator [Streptomonospora nanhaiensis]|uniref:AcrR family transcriptional regulator n=1 Tax=Streptomonospora nanhaiensis TaxID=1323731 RepID=A0A853BVE0_9ACTN|nr:TetR family transcriptional regulator [Streptomonospora nanhaiensis]MBV2363467.1 TetR family transcriptional regulator [Streptomonospora nanhaiensis]MBX9389688.1 TetR family transcriptional regulator [Streptomonospora nanhaiensis]NYI98477.1 AcrR family transcriptional regulator [Streptomonospora nanhaiensis]